VWVEVGRGVCDFGGGLKTFIYTFVFNTHFQPPTGGIVFGRGLTLNHPCHTSPNLTDHRETEVCCFCVPFEPPFRTARNAPFRGTTHHG